MLKLWTALVVLTLFALRCVAQDKPQVQRSLESELPENARFQVVYPLSEKTQLPILRLDRYSGQVFRLGTCAKDAKIGSEKCWREQVVIDLSREASSAHARFQIFLGGNPSLLFLINSETGQTWQYGLGDPDKWYPFLDTVFLP